MKDEIARTVKGIYGAPSEDWEIINHRICW